MSADPELEDHLAQRPFTTTDMEILAFERTAPTSRGRKADLVLEWFGFGITTYYARLNAAIAKPAALAYDPTLVHRLRRVRDTRRTRRRPDTRWVN